MSEAPVYEMPVFHMDDFDWGPFPDEPCPEPPPHHVDSYSCQHGLCGGSDKPEWLLCDCEDPSDPWPPRPANAGPRDCSCYFCSDLPRRERGLIANCEMYDHHCPSCHEAGHCTKLKCK